MPAYDVFLSYNDRDREAVQGIRERLKERGIAAFADRADLPAGQPRPHALEEALRDVRAVAVFVGPHGLDRWQRQEVSFALDRKGQEEQEGHTFPVVFVLLPKANPTPDLLSATAWLDLRHDPADPAVLDALARAIRGETIAPQPETPLPLYPYRGWRAFREEDAPLFFGREKVIDRLWDALRDRDLIALVGPSGSGKTSIVQAGLMPRLRCQRPPQTTWDIALFTPGDRPFYHLAEVLVPLLEPGLNEVACLEKTQRLADMLAGGTVSLEDTVERVLQRAETDRLLLVADRFEELLSRTPEEERRPFVETLLRAVEHVPLTVLLTLRADAYSRAVALNHDLGRRVEQGVVALEPMGREDLRRVIEEPARRLAMSLDLGLVQRILDDVGDEPGALPILEAVLLELCSRARGRFLTHAAYDAIGGVAGFLAQHAEAVFNQLPPEDQAIAQRTFTRLVHVSRAADGREDTRQRIPLSALDIPGMPHDHLARVVRALADARLLVTSRDPVTGEATVDLAHQALICGWAQLQAWLDADRDFLLWRQWLQAAREEWQRTGHDEGALLRGALLAEAERWLARRAEDLNGDEQKYIRESITVRERERAQQEQVPERVPQVPEEERPPAREEAPPPPAREEQRREYLWRGAAIVAVVVAVVFLILGVLAWYQRKVAVQQWESAVAAQATLLAQLQSPVTPGPPTETRPVPEMTARAELPEVQAAVTAAAEAEARYQEIASAQATAEARYQEVERERRVAEARRLAAQSRLMLKDTGVGLVRGALLALESLQRTFTPEGEQALRDALALLPRPLAHLVHEVPVRAVAFSPDGTRLATAGNDGTARVWNLITGEETSAFAHGSPILTLNFSPDGTRLATAGTDNVARVWDLTTGQEQRRLPYDGVVFAIAFSPDGKWLATAHDTGTIRVWDLASGEERWRLAQEGGVSAIAFSPRSTHLATVGRDGGIQVWDLTSGQEQVRLSSEGTVRGVTFNPDGTRLATGGDDGTVQVWDLTARRALVRLSHAGPVRALAFSPDGRWLVTAGEDAAARVWDITLGRELARMPHEKPLYAAVFSPDGNRVATAGADGVARVWDLTAPRALVIFPHKAPVLAATFSPDGARLATVSDNAVRVWDPTTGRELTRLSQRAPVFALSFSPDGQQLATASNDHTVRVWELGTGKEVARLVHKGPVLAVTFHPDGTRLATASWDGTARVWNLSTGKELARLSHEDAVGTVTFSPNGAYLATASGRTVHVWDATTGEERVRLSPDGPVFAIAFSPDSKRLATASGDPLTNWGEVRLWDVTTGEMLARLAHDGPVFTLAFSSDGAYLASAGGDHTVRVWDLATHREVVRLSHAAPVRAVAFSPDGAWLASADDTTARVWDATTGEAMAYLPHRASVQAVAFSPDGSRLATASSDRTARVWLWRLDDLRVEACARLPRNLTLAEWRQYIGDEPYQKTCENLPEPGK